MGYNKQKRNTMIFALLFKIFPLFILQVKLSTSNQMNEQEKVNNDIKETMVDKSTTLSELESWLSLKVYENKKMIGISAFILTTEGKNNESNTIIDTIVAGNSVIEKAWDTTNKKIVKETPKKVKNDATFMIASVSKTI